MCWWSSSASQCWLENWTRLRQKFKGWDWKVTFAPVKLFGGLQHVLFQSNFCVMTHTRRHFSVWTGGPRAWLPTLWLMGNHSNACSCLHVNVKTWAHTKTPKTYLEPWTMTFKHRLFCNSLNVKKPTCYKNTKAWHHKRWTSRVDDDYSREEAPVLMQTLWAACFFNSPEQTSQWIFKRQSHECMHRFPSYGSNRLHQDSLIFILHICVTPTLLPMAGGLVSRERLLANSRLGAQVITTLIVMLLHLLLLMLMLLLQLLHHL